jgi:hypothetical protein
MLYLDDVLLPTSSAWHGEPKKYDELAEFARAGDVSPAPPAIPEQLRELYGVDRAFAPSPRIPEPYATFDETFSYGREGSRA